MKNIVKRLNKTWLAGFVPLTIAGLIVGGVKPLWILSTALGVAYLAWQIYDA